jgi:thiamine biosynthesis protein ThiS
MNLILNGKSHIHNGNGSLTALLSEIQADKQQIAIMINNDIIKKETIGNITLQDGDQIEIITYAAGG